MTSPSSGRRVPSFPAIDDLAVLPVTYRDCVQEEWIDVMGHMNVSWYVHVFSNAMGGLLSHLGMDEGFLLSERRGSFALEAHVHYLSELRAGTDLRVHSRFLARSGKRFHVMHFLVNDVSERLSATFETVGACVDLDSRHMAAIPERIGAAADRLIAEHAALPWPAPLTGVMGP